MNTLVSFLRIASVAMVVAIASCGGKGSSAPPPVGGITVTPGNSSATVTWTMTPGVQYWLMLAPTAGPIDMKNPPSGYQWRTVNVASPFVVAGLTNGVTYSFAMNARTDGGPGGDQTPSVSTVPRMAGGLGSWTVNSTLLSGDVLGVSSGLASDALTYSVAVGSAGAYKSADGGLNWLPAGDTPPANLRAVTYATLNGVSQFFAVGDDGAGGANKIYSSANLQSWSTAGTVPAGSGLYAIGLGSDGTNPILVAVGNNGQVLSSSNGDVWLQRASAGSSTLNGLVYGNGFWYAVSQRGDVFASSNLANAWSLVTTSPGNTALNAVAISPGNVIVAVGASGKVLTSKDGSTWSPSTVSPGNDLYAVTVDSAQYMVVGTSAADGTAGAFTSPGPDTNTIWTWTPQTTGISRNAWRAVFGTASAYVAVGLGGVNAVSK